MASMTTRGDSFSLRWRFAGRNQSCTFRGPSPVKAIAAKHFIETRRHQVASAQVYAAIDPDSTKAVPLASTPLLRDWIERWVRLKVDVAPGTHAEYARLLRYRVARDVGDLRVGDISRHEHLDPWKASLAGELGPAGVRKHWAVLSQVMRDAVPQYRSDNPMRCPPGRRGNGLPRLTPRAACLLTREQADLLLARCEPSIQGLVLAALGTGMRLGELLGLRVGSVRLHDRVPVVQVDQALHRGGVFGPVKTPRSRRTILLSPRTAAVFAASVAGRQPDELVFASPEGRPWDAGNMRQRFWWPAVIAAQRCDQHPPAASRCAVSTCRCPTRLSAGPRFHDLRHSHVAYLIAAGWDFYMIQLRLGHASIKTTFDTYGHLMPHGERDRLPGLDSWLPSPPSHTPGAA